MYFDIGANVGKWTIANKNINNEIISIEASPKVYNNLRENLINHNIHNLCLNYAVCDNNGNDIIFYECVCDTLSTINKDWLTNINNRFSNIPYTEIKCKTITIDKLIEIYGMPELIKIDVEGGEYECIKSLTKKVNNICFEWASETNNITYKCLDYLSLLGYNNFYIQFEDLYDFRPDINKYTDINTVKKILSETTPKNEWGMIWCR